MMSAVRTRGCGINWDGKCGSSRGLGSLVGVRRDIRVAMPLCRVTSGGIVVGMCSLGNLHGGNSPLAQMALLARFGATPGDFFHPLESANHYIDRICV